MIWFHIITVILLILKLIGILAIGWFVVFLPSLIAITLGLIGMALVLLAVLCR